MLVWPHEVEPWFHSWYRGRVETLDAKYNLAYDTPLHVTTPTIQRELPKWRLHTEQEIYNTG